MAANNPELRSSGTRRRDFWIYWTGQTISNLGSSVTIFALPLLVYKLTGSALNLSITTATTFIPYLLFGLLLGSIMDRVDRRQAMILSDLARALIIASLPLVAILGHLPIWWIYIVSFLQSTLKIFFDAGEFAALPSLVSQDDLVTANGRIQASYNAASIAGPLLAGLLVAFIPFTQLLFIDAASFLVSAATLALIAVSFNGSEPMGERKSIFHDAIEGLKYVVGHPVLRNISIMMALFNFFGASYGAELVLFAKERLSATDTQFGLLNSAGSLGIVLLSLLAGPLRKRWSFSKVALGALMLDGAMVVLFAWNRWYWAAVVLEGLSAGLGILFNINTSSLRQAIVPNNMLARVMSIAGVLAWSAIPLGAILGGLAITWTHNVALVFGIIGVVYILIPFGFSFTPLGHAEQYLPKKELAVAEGAGTAVEPLNP